MESIAAGAVTKADQNLPKFHILRTLFRELRRGIAAFRASASAASAVEFAMLSPLFLAPMFATIQVIVVYAAKTQLDEAVNSASRQIMTGAVTTNAQLSNALCKGTGVLLDCTQYNINLVPYASLAALQNAGSSATGNPTLTFNSGGGLSNSFSQTFGTTGNIMVLQVIYQFPVIGWGIFQLTSQSNGELPLVSTSVFIQE